LQQQFFLSLIGLVVYLPAKHSASTVKCHQHGSFVHSIARKTLRGFDSYGSSSNSSIPHVMCRIWCHTACTSVGSVLPSCCGMRLAHMRRVRETRFAAHVCMYDHRAAMDMSSKRWRRFNT
jgi:hypothetical protein